MFEGLISAIIFFLSIVFYSGITYSIIRLNSKMIEEVKCQIKEINVMIISLIERISKIETIIENRLMSDPEEK